MKPLKIISIVLIAVSFLGCSSQDGLELLQLARTNYEQGNLTEALTLLEQANESDFGTCGNTYLNAFVEINDLKIKIYLEKGEYQQARQLLDSSHFYGGNLDSLRIKAFQLELGASVLSELIDTSLSMVNFELDPKTKFIYAKIPLSNGEDTIRIEAVDDLNVMNQIDLEDIELDQWIANFRASKKYGMIKTKSLDSIPTGF